MGGEALGQGDEGGLAQVGQVHLGLAGERRVGGHGEEDVVAKQRQRLAVRIGHAVVERHQDGVQLEVLQLVQQVDVGAEDQVDVQLAAPQLEAHDQLRHRLHRQRVERAELEALGGEAGRLAGQAHGVEHVGDQLLRAVLQHVGTFQRTELAPLALEQRAAQGVFQRVQGAMHADRAGVQLGGGARQVAAAHEGQEDFQLLEGQFFVDLHDGVRWRRCLRLCRKAGRCARSRRKIVFPAISPPLCGPSV
ncbi:hypothetical protein D3C75_668610 [compost metagenome]